METVNSFMPYLYCFLIAVIVIMLIRILIKLSGFSRTAGITASKIEHINTKVDELNKSKEKIDYTVKNSLPLFISAGSVYALFKLIANDYKKTDRNYRSIAKSSIKAAVKKPSAAKVISSIPRSF